MIDERSRVDAVGSGPRIAAMGFGMGAGLVRLFGRAEVAAAAFVLTLGPLVLTNDLNAAHVLFAFVLLPLAVLHGVAIAADPVGAATLRRLPRSIVLIAVTAYLLALTLASAMQPDATPRLIRRLLQFDLEIVAFVAATALLTATSRQFLRLASLGLAAVVAASALVNVAMFLPTLPADAAALLGWRLMAVLGMPEYANSTNIGATYAVVLAIAVATLATLARKRAERVALAIATVILAVALVLTQARGAAAGALCGLAALAATQSHRIRLAIAAGGLLLVAVLVATPLGHDWIERGMSYRPEVWTTFLAKAAERPLLGWGVHTDLTVTIPSGLALDQAHNLVLSGLVRGGAGAAVAMAVILVGGLAWSIRLVRAGGSPLPLCAMVTMTVAGMVDYNLLITRPAWPWLTFWLPIGLAAGAELAVRADGRRSDEPDRSDTTEHAPA